MQVIYSQPDRPIYIVKIDDYDYAMVNPFKEAENKVKHSVTPETFLKWCSFVECIQVPETTMWAIEKAIQKDPDEFHWNERKAEEIKKWKEMLARRGYDTK